MVRGHMLTVNRHSASSSHLYVYLFTQATLLAGSFARPSFILYN